MAGISQSVMWCIARASHQVSLAGLVGESHLIPGLTKPIVTDVDHLLACTVTPALGVPGHVFHVSIMYTLFGALLCPWESHRPGIVP